MSYEAIREKLRRSKEQLGEKEFSEGDKLLLSAVQQLTIALESDLTQIKVALGHVARLLEARRDRD
jgi:flagellar motor switch protein FliM